MEFCKRHKLLHVLPRSGRRIAWSWRTENGTIFRIAGRDRSEDCRIEVLNVLLPLVGVLLALIVCLRRKCEKRRVGSSGGRLPFHTTRTSFCISILLILLLEVCESFLTTVSLSSIFTVFAVVSCWILHRRTEVDGSDDSGIAFTAAIFAAIGSARAWKCVYLSRYGLSIGHVRFATAASTAILCGSFAVLDSYALYLTARRKRRRPIGRAADEPETAYRHSEATFVGRITFHWVVGLLSKGYEAPLERQDLGQLPEEESAARQFEKFKAILDEEREKGRLSLWRCFWKRVWFPFAVGGFLKLLGDAAALVGPMTISKILDHVSATRNGTDHRTYRSAMTFSEILDNGYFLALLAFAFALLQSTLSQASTHVLCVEGIRLKTALQALLYDKALRSCSWSIDEDDEKDGERQRGQRTTDTAALTNLVSEDAYNVMSFFWIGHYAWAIPLKIAAIVFLLYAKLGVGAIVGALCCILLVAPVQLILGKKMSENFKSVTSRSDARLRLVNEVLQGMKLAKLRAWEDVFERKIARTRDEELEALDKDSLYWALINFLSHASSVLTTLFAFGARYWIEDRSLEAGNVFAGLALFSQLTVPLLIFPVTIPIVVDAMVSTTRMEDFLRLPDMENVLPDLRDGKSKEADADDDDDDDDDASSRTDSVEESTVAATKVQSDATYGSLGNIVEDEEDGESCGSRDYRCRVDVDSSADTVFEKDPETPILRIKECAFSVRDSEEGKPPMSIQALDFPRGQLTLIVGKTGSGKTSLLLGMLGEIQRTSGSIEWSKGSKIAYVAQRAWLLNATFRDNILFGSAYRPKRYRSVLKACALQPDVDVLPGQDLARIGENGINLSGGQKQRIAIARAIYSDADVAIMDDPLSALDPQVGRQIFDQGIRKLLLRTGRTVVMVTHRLDLLSAAHRVIVMDDCRVRATGTKSAIEESDPKLATEWRNAATRQQDRRNSRRIARDRWSLPKLVHRIGITAKNENAADGSWIAEQDARANPPTFVPLRMRRTVLSGSSYLTPDLADLPVPTDEWNIAEKPSKFHRNAARSISLQPQRRPPPVLRQSSTPTMLESGRVAPRKRNNTFDNGRTSGVFAQIFSGRSSQVREQDRLPAKRLLSVESKGAESNDAEEGSCDEEDRESCEDGRGTVTGTICLDYSKAGGWIPGSIYAGLAILCQIVRVYTDLWLGRWTDRESETLGEGEENTWFYFRVYIALSASSILLSFACNAVGQWTGARARRRLHEEAISRLLRAPLSFFERNPVGKILSRFSADTGVIDKKLSTSIQRLTFFALLCGSAIAVNAIVSPWFLVAALPTCAIYYLVQRFYRRTARHLQRLDGRSSHVESLETGGSVHGSCYQVFGRQRERVFTFERERPMVGHRIGLLGCRDSGRSDVRRVDFRGTLSESRDTGSGGFSDQLYSSGTHLFELGGEVHRGDRDVHGQRGEDFRLQARRIRRLSRRGRRRPQPGARSLARQRRNRVRRRVSDVPRAKGTGDLQPDLEDPGRTEDRCLRKNRERQVHRDDGALSIGGGCSRQNPDRRGRRSSVAFEDPSIQTLGDSSGRDHVRWHHSGKLGPPPRARRSRTLERVGSRADRGRRRFAPRGSRLRGSRRRRELLHGSAAAALHGPDDPPEVADRRSRRGDQRAGRCHREVASEDGLGHLREQNRDRYRAPCGGSARLRSHNRVPRGQDRRGWLTGGSVRTTGRLLREHGEVQRQGRGREPLRARSLRENRSRGASIFDKRDNRLELQPRIKKMRGANDRRPPARRRLRPNHRSLRFERGGEPVGDQRRLVRSISKRDRSRIARGTNVREEWTGYRSRGVGPRVAGERRATVASGQGVKRVCHRHASDEECKMRFSCFPRPNILGQSRSINFPPLPANNDDSDSVVGISIVNGSYRQPVERELSYGVIRPLADATATATTTTVNGTNPLPNSGGKSKAPPPPPPSQPRNRSPLPTHRENDREDAGPATDADRPVNNPRGGVIGRTPTPPSAPTPVYDKDAKSSRQIKKAILENEFLGNLEENQVDAVVSAMYPKQIPPSTLVIKEGDMGSHLYVSAEGEFDIYQGNKFQRSFGPGVAFGEIALLYNTKRLRSISVKKGGKVWVLDRSVFLTIMMKTAQERLEGNVRFLRQVSVLQKLPEPKDHLLAKISDLIRLEFFLSGAKIVTQGEKGDKFYIISGGNVRITKSTEQGGEVEMVVLGKGQYFGEKALYDDEGENRRHATAVALAPGVECLTLDRTSFLNYLGGLDEIRNKNWVAEYEKQKRSLTPRNWTNEYLELALTDLETRGTLGVGGFGRVDLVVLKSDRDKSFALKKLKKKVMVEQQQQEHVLNEKHIMQACDSPFICKLYQTYKDSKYVYFLMEVCLGGDVWTTLQKRRHFDDATAQFMVGCVVEAFDHLHSLNIVYRDLKPENLMLDSRGYLKLVDFGFSKKIGPSKTWTFAGTPEYVAPEIILNRGHDRAVDYWALGILTHELLVGKPPFRAADHMTTYNRILKGIEVVGIPSIVGRNASNLIKKLLRLNPSERLGYQRNGIQDIRDHKWFHNFNWQALQKLTLPAPIVPTVRSQIDTRNFERYPPDHSVPPDEFSGWDEQF
ncbi:uncharacterized protein LOC117218023 isoform X2 [Megalopta genalis]|uniref:uncharacterized protein LOC117218023 isoform X2 n=1 Tax=Megalopta genalis TaxID=115081 RepID=UPI003FD476A5